MSDPWFDRNWLEHNWASLLRAARDHVLWSLLAFGLGFAAALFLVTLGRRWRSLDQPLRALALVASAVPAVSVVSTLLPTVTSRVGLIGAIAVSVTALVYRTTMHGLDRVDPNLVAEALALGYGRWQRLAWVEFPLAIRAIRSGIRCASIAAVGLVAVGGPTLHGGLGNTIAAASGAGHRTERVMAIALLIVLCIMVDAGVRLMMLRAPSGDSLRPQERSSRRQRRNHQTKPSPP